MRPYDDVCLSLLSSTLLCKWAVGICIWAFTFRAFTYGHLHFGHLHIAYGHLHFGHLHMGIYIFRAFAYGHFQIFIGVPHLQPITSQYQPTAGMVGQQPRSQGRRVARPGSSAHPLPPVGVRWGSCTCSIFPPAVRVRRVHTRALHQFDDGRPQRACVGQRLLWI